MNMKINKEKDIVNTYTNRIPLKSVVPMRNSGGANAPYQILVLAATPLPQRTRTYPSVKEILKLIRSQCMFLARVVKWILIRHVREKKQQKRSPISVTDGQKKRGDKTEQKRPPTE